jgi:hypothetical protein
LQKKLEKSDKENALLEKVLRITGAGQENPTVA